MKLPRLELPAGWSGSVSDGRVLATVGTLVFVLLGLIGLVVAFDTVQMRSSAAEEMRGRLDALLARPLPTPPPATSKASADADGDMRMFAGASEGEAVAALQTHLTSIIDGAGLRLRRVAVENANDETNSHRLVVSLEARGGTNALQSALYQIETGFPYLEVAMLDVQRADTEAEDTLDVTATITGTWREVKP